jgi:hypothetical protein
MSISKVSLQCVTESCFAVRLPGNLGWLQKRKSGEIPALTRNRIAGNSCLFTPRKRVLGAKCTGKIFSFPELAGSGRAAEAVCLRSSK